MKSKITFFFIGILALIAATNLKKKFVPTGIELNHTIVQAKDKLASAKFFSEMLGLPAPTVFSHFLVVQTDNGVSLDFSETKESIQTQHYAFLVTEKKFNEIFARIKQRKLNFWADPFGQKPGEINHNDGGRGVYFNDPAGHKLEIITKPYGS